MEREQRMPVVNDDTEHAALVFNAGALTTPFASGKTVVILALVASVDHPRRVPMIVGLPELLEPVNADLSTVHGCGLPRRDELTTRRGVGARSPFGEPRHRAGSTMMCPPDVLLEWFPDRVIPSTLVVASNSVLSHWEATMHTFLPHLSCFTIDTVERLREYIRLVQKGQHCNFHVVLLKMGEMAYQIAGHKKSNTLSAVSLGLPGFVWDRLVIDDYDTIRVPKAARLPPAFFTWYVSATRRSTMCGVVLDDPHFPMTQDSLGVHLDSLLPGGWPAIVAVRDWLLATNLTVNCTAAFQDANFVLPAPIVVDYGFNVPRGLALLKGVDISPEAQEALDAGAVHTAAELLGFNCSNPVELAARVLNKHKDHYAKAKSELDALEHVRGCLKNRTLTYKKILAQNVPPILTAIREGWRPASHADVPPCVPTDVHFGDKFDKACLDFEIKRQKICTTSRRTLDRLCENAAGGECQVCLMPWESTADSSNKTYVMKCCQLLLCKACVTTREGNNKFVRECPNCFKPTFTKDKCTILAMDSNINVQDIKLEDITEQAAIPAAHPTSTHGSIDDAWRKFGKDDKLRALLQLIEGSIIQYASSEPGSEIPGVIGNDGPLIPLPPDSNHRFLVFSQHPESTNRILDALSFCNFKAAMLKGTRAAKDKMISKFRNSTAPREVLIITASRDCAGIHLPECTHQIFFHKMLSKDVSAQLAGRAQRHGRRASLLVYNLFYTK